MTVPSCFRCRIDENLCRECFLQEGSEKLICLQEGWEESIREDHCREKGLVVAKQTAVMGEEAQAQGCREE